MKIIQYHNLKLNIYCWRKNNVFRDTVSPKNEKHLYIPWSTNSAVDNLSRILIDITNKCTSEYVNGKVVDYHYETISRELKVMHGLGEKYGRNDLDYRLHVALDKSKG